MTTTTKQIQIRNKDNGKELVQSAFSSKTLTKEQVNILRTQIAPDISDNDLMYCLEVSDRCGLNPILKDIYFVPRMAKVNERWVTKHEPMVGRKGARTIARRKGMKIPPNTGHTIKKFPVLKNNEWVEERDLVGWAELIIDGIAVRKEAAYSTYKQTKKDGTVTKFWQDMPTVMVEKVAEFQLLDAIYGLDGVLSIDAGVLEDEDVTNVSFLTEEAEKALTALGISLQKYNGSAIALNYSGKEKYLVEFGFQKQGGNYVISYIEEAKNETPKIKNTEPLLREQSIAPAKELFVYLAGLGMSKEQIGSFVSDVLGLTKDDNEGILEVLEDKNLLGMMAGEFMSEGNGVPADTNDDPTLF